MKRTLCATSIAVTLLLCFQAPAQAAGYLSESVSVYVFNNSQNYIKINDRCKYLASDNNYEFLPPDFVSLVGIEHGGNGITLPRTLRCEQSYCIEWFHGIGISRGGDECFLIKTEIDINDGYPTVFMTLEPGQNMTKGAQGTVISDWHSVFVNNHGAIVISSRSDSVLREDYTPLAARKKSK